MPTLRNVGEQVVIKGQPFIVESVKTSVKNKDLEVLYMRKPLGERLWMSSRIKGKKDQFSRPTPITGFNAR